MADEAGLEPKITAMFSVIHQTSYAVSKYTYRVHCKYIRPDYDGTLAIHRSSTMIHCRLQLQCSIGKVLIQNCKTSDQLKWQNTISKIVKIPAIGRRMSIRYIVHTMISEIVQIAV